MRFVSKFLTVIIFAGSIAFILGQSDTERFATESLRGIVLPSKHVTLMAPLDAVLIELDVEEGDPVEQNQVIGRMDDGIQKQALAAAKLEAEAQGALLRAQHRLAEAKIMIEKTQAAFDQKAASEWEVRRDKVAVDIAQAELVSAQEAQQMAHAQYELEAQRLERYAVRAPFDGRVIRTQAEQGATLTQQDAIVVIAHMRTLEAHISLPVALYGKLNRGETYQLMGEAPVNRRLSARLKTIDPMIDSASQTFRCVFEIDNADEALPAGFHVHLIWPQ